MKRNLLALVAILILVAVAAKMHKDPARGALESDLRISLERLWGNHDHQVALVNAKGGVVVRVTVVMPAQGVASWNEPFLRFLLKRHRKLPISGLEITPPAGPQPGARLELLQRQLQSTVDSQVGEGRGLILLDGSEPPATTAAPAPTEARQEAPAVMERSSPGESARRPVAPESNRVVSPQQPANPVISQECLVIAEQVSDENVRQLEKDLQSEVTCSQFRVVRLASVNSD